MKLNKQLLFLVSINLLVMCLHVNGQNEGSPHINSSKIELTKMLANPNDFTSEERTNIYLNHAATFFASNIDSINIVYEEMVDFGLSINDQYLTGVAYSSMAMMAGMAGKADEQMRLEKLALNNTGGNSQFASVMLGSLGESYIRKDKLDSAQILIDSSISIVTKNRDTVMMAHAFLQKSELLKRQQKYYSALDMGLKALDKAGHSWTPMKKANAYQIIGLNYQEIGNQKMSIEYMQKALAITSDKGYKRFTAELHVFLGANYRINGEHDIAREYLLKSIPYLQEKTMNDKLCQAYSQLALIELENKDVTTAKKYIKEAEALLVNQTLFDDRIVLHLARARTLFLDGKYSGAKAAYQKMVSLGEKANTISSQLSGYGGLQKIAVKRADWQNAFNYANKMNELRKDADLSNQQRLIFDLESKYQSELKSEKIENLRNNQKLQDFLIDRRERQLIFTGLALFLALASIVGFVTAYRTKQKSLSMLSVQNEKLNMSLTTNKMLVKEIHHRVKNNLQVVSSLLNIQSRFEKDDSVIKAINSGKFRVQSMSLLHQNLYANENLNQINVKKYFTDLAHGIVDGYPLGQKKLNLELHIDDLSLDLDTLVPLGLIANELMTNSLKYAFSDDPNCELMLSVKQYGDKIRLTVKDNGEGLPFEEVPKRPKTMGMQLIQSFVKKINAIVEIDNFNGAEIRITFEKQNISSQLSA